MATDTCDSYPDFLSTDFFTTALANGLNEPPSSVHISSVTLSAGSKSGENFCSDIYRAVVKFHIQAVNKREQSVSLIVKAMPYTEARGPLLDDLQAFAKEVSMYTDTLPRISQLLGGLKLSAKYYYSVQTPVEIIVFEDLRASGFKLADRLAGIDEAHCLLVLEKLGQLHAASMILAERDAHAMDPYSFGIVNPNASNNIVMKTVFEEGLKAVLRQVNTWPGYERSAEHIRALENNFICKMDRHCNHSASFYKVLNHGDCWINNFMFRYDMHGAPVELVFIDFQMSFYTSPGHDLNYFLNTSPTNQLRENSREYLISSYHKAFDRALKKMKSPLSTMLTLDRVRDEVDSREFFGFYAAVGILPIVLKVQDNSDTSLDAMTGADSALAIQNAMYNNPAYVEAMKFIIRRCDEQRVFENVQEL